MTTGQRIRALHPVFRNVLPPFLVARVLVGATLVLAHLTVTTFRPDNPGAQLRVGTGLLMWDGGWYHLIANEGYAGAGEVSLRFFPAFPILARYLAEATRIDVGVMLILVANLAALLAMAALWVLVARDLGDERWATRSVWLLALAPAGYVLALGYADSLLLLCAVVALLAARRQWWWWSAGFGLLGGLTRPLGVLVVVPVVIEWVRLAPWRRSATWATRLAAGSAVVAPVLGLGIYLAWVGEAFGNALLPWRIQESGSLHGPLQLPFAAAFHDVAAAAGGHHLGSALHLPWVVLAIVLCVIAFRRLPASYGALAASVLMVSLATSNFDSFERYALGAFPLVIAASSLTGRRRIEWIVLGVSAACMCGYFYLALIGSVVP